VLILFLDVDHEADWAVAAVGPAFIAAYLRRHGHSVSLQRIPLNMSISDAVEAIREHNPDVLGISLTSRQWLRARDLIGGIRETLDIPVIAGGLHATFESNTVLASPGFDYACLGEGEEPMLELVETLARQPDEPVRGIRNIRARGEPVPELRPPFQPIDDLPFMARDMLDEHYGVVHFCTQRGCPYPCTYCAARQFSDLYGSYAEYGRRRSHENVFRELADLRHNGELNYVLFLDDTFTINHDWVRTFCKIYGEEFRVPFSLHARVETVTQQMLEQLADAGCRHIVYGVESGSERIRRDIMKRNAPNQRFVDVFRWTKEAGILVTANYIIGIPGETSDDIEETIALHQLLEPDDFGYFIFYPYPGTALFEICRERGYLPDDYHELPANHRRSILKLPDLSEDEIERHYQRFTKLRIEAALKRMPEGTDRLVRDAVAQDVSRTASHA
jgi:radical SAM superfamily enzyme YgiQ (UPF0313 family)